MISKPKAVIISDIHFSLSTLDLASKALISAINKAADLQIPLILAGDTTDTKAIIRAEVANKLLQIMNYASERDVHVFILIGNHDLVNEKGKEHALNFLGQHNVTLVDKASELEGYDFQASFIPYQSANQDFIDKLHRIPKGNLVIAHQGFKGAAMGDYIQDTSSVDPKDCEGYRIFSGHYHKHQTLGNITYVGNPYTLSFGEANDGPKGFLVLYDDGSFEREILDLRKHVVYEWDFLNLKECPVRHTQNDLVWMKIKGTKDYLQQVNKQILSENFIGHSNFRLDLIPIDQEPTKLSKFEKLTDSEMFDKLIDATPGATEELKKLWREIYESN